MALWQVGCGSLWVKEHSGGKGVGFERVIYHDHLEELASSALNSVPQGRTECLGFILFHI